MCIHRVLDFSQGVVYEVYLDIGRLRQENGGSHTARVVECRDGTQQGVCRGHASTPCLHD